MMKGQGIRAPQIELGRRERHERGDEVRSQGALDALVKDTFTLAHGLLPRSAQRRRRRGRRRVCARSESENLGDLEQKRDPQRTEWIVVHFFWMAVLLATQHSARKAQGLHKQLRESTMCQRGIASESAFVRLLTRSNSNSPSARLPTRMIPRKNSAAGASATLREGRHAAGSE